VVALTTFQLVLFIVFYRGLLFIYISWLFLCNRWVCDGRNCIGYENWCHNAWNSFILCTLHKMKLSVL